MAFPDRRKQEQLGHTNPQFASWEVGVRYDIEKYVIIVLYIAVWWYLH